MYVIFLILLLALFRVAGAASHVAVFNWLEEQKTTSAIEEVGKYFNPIWPRGRGGRGGGADLPPSSLKVQKMPDFIGLKAMSRNVDKNDQQGEWRPPGPTSSGGRICCRPLPWGMS